ncbi:hypothetical protein VTK26DRAFT_3260 [Humicola hyalothermophila]
METSAPKRRRTSPRTAVPIQPETTTPRDDPPRTLAAGGRPSFASPTRASLERFNPDILRRRESQPRRLRSSPDAPSASRAATPDSTGGLTRALRTQLELRSGTRDDGPRPVSEEGSVLRSPARRLGTGATATRPIPRPLPPPGPDDDEDFLSAVPDRRPLRSLGVLPDVTVPEPQLPPTPERPDPVVSTPPSGIHNTPSRRPRRSRALAEKIKSSSPLKQAPTQPPGSPTKGVPLDFGIPAKRSPEVAGTTSAAPTAAELRGLKPADPDAEKKKLRDVLLAEIAQLERDLDVASKENERIRQARLARREPSPPTNERDILQLLRRHALPEPDADPPERDGPAAAWLASALNPIALLPFSKPTTSAPPLPKPIRPPTPSSSETANDDIVSHHPLPMSAAEALPYLQVFSPLAFSAHVSPLPATRSGDPSAAEGGEAEERVPPLLLQHHSIAVAPAPPLPRSLFAARVDMTVDTSTMQVVGLAVPRLDPSAEAELRGFLDTLVVAPPPPRPPHSSSSSSSSGGSSGLRGNVSVLCWAMGEWLRVAVQRAKVWAVLEREIGGGGGDGKVGRVAELVARMRAAAAAGRKRKGGKRKRKRWVDQVVREGEGGGGGDEDADEEQVEKEEEMADGLEAGKHDAGELLPFMGRTSMDFEIPVLDARGGGGGGRGGGAGEVSALRVQWRIKFDWTGEARSEIGVLVGVPGKWHKSDERGRLSGIPGLFDDLIQGGEDPLTAVRTVVCLLAGEQRP